MNTFFIFALGCVCGFVAALVVGIFMETSDRKPREHIVKVEREEDPADRWKHKDE